MLKLTLDHVALGLPTVATAEPFLEGVLGGRKAGGLDGVPFGFMQWAFAGGGRIEVIYPTGESGGFLHRFLARAGPGVHHVTFKVSSLDETLVRARTMGYAIASEDRSDPYWQEAFLHPKQAQGIVVQLVEQRPRGPEVGPSATRPPAAAARVIGPRLGTRSAAAARRLWGDLLGAAESRAGDALAFAWPDAPLMITVDIEPTAEPGPRSIEIEAAPHLVLPAGPVPGLGTRFVQRAAT